jgi:hypothetical protein
LKNDKNKKIIVLKSTIVIVYIYISALYLAFYLAFYLPYYCIYIYIFCRLYGRYSGILSSYTSCAPLHPELAIGFRSIGAHSHNELEEETRRRKSCTFVEI